jgi:hypothetical protein
MTILLIFNNLMKLKIKTFPSEEIPFYVITATPNLHPVPVLP